MPNSQDWIRALFLTLVAYCGSIIPMFGFWVFVLMGVLSSVASLDPSPLQLWIYALFFIGIGAVWFILASFFAGSFLVRYWDDYPFYLNSVTDIETMLFNYAIAVWASLPLSVIWLAIVISNPKLKSLESADFASVAVLLLEKSRPSLIINLFWLWTIFAALCFSYQRIRKNR